MDLAKEAAIAAVELLGEYDQVGVLAFDDQNHWMIQPTFASDLAPIEDAAERRIALRMNYFTASTGALRPTGSPAPNCRSALARTSSERATCRDGT